ncbi:MAG: nucleotidyltransferase domain-containing protein [Candidatus Methanoplasma sp.]|jgi:predicted nucleotidyltransferase|nr:nucleotidyltransferase domain-containing protein [Candidatus Methanoplasma sp.]
MGLTHANCGIGFEDLREIVAPIAERYGITRVYLFGSRTRGDNKEGSDFDFCVSPGKVKGMIPLCGFMIDMEEALGTDVDVVTDRSLSEDFIQEVHRDGRLIYESGS